MEKQLEFEFPVMLKDYNVYINGKLKACVDTEREAWRVVGEGSIGQCHLVTNLKGETREEFVPF